MKGKELTGRGRYAIQAIAGILILLAGIIVAGVWPEINGWIVMILLLSGVTFLLTGVVMLWKPSDEPAYDERIRKIRAYTLSYAWQFTFLVIVVLYLLDRAGVLRLAGQEVLVTTFFALAGSGSIFQWYLFRKGDVE